jgi:hypothetical protein
MGIDGHIECRYFVKEYEGSRASANKERRESSRKHPNAEIDRDNNNEIIV